MALIGRCIVFLAGTMIPGLPLVCLSLTASATGIGVTLTQPVSSDTVPDITTEKDLASNSLLMSTPSRIDSTNSTGMTLSMESATILKDSTPIFESTTSYSATEIGSTIPASDTSVPPEDTAGTRETVTDSSTGSSTGNSEFGDPLNTTTDSTSSESITTVAPSTVLTDTSTAETTFVVAPSTVFTENSITTDSSMMPFSSPGQPTGTTMTTDSPVHMKSSTASPTVTTSGASSSLSLDPSTHASSPAAEITTHTAIDVSTAGPTTTTTTPATYTATDVSTAQPTTTITTPATSSRLNSSTLVTTATTRITNVSSTTKSTFPATTHEVSPHMTTFTDEHIRSNITTNSATDVRVYTTESTTTKSDLSTNVSSSSTWEATRTATSDPPTRVSTPPTRVSTPPTRVSTPPTRVSTPDPNHTTTMNTTIHMTSLPVEYTTSSTDAAPFPSSSTEKAVSSMTSLPAVSNTVTTDKQTVLTTTTDSPGSAGSASTHAPFADTTESTKTTRPPSTILPAPSNEPPAAIVNQTGTASHQNGTAAPTSGGSEAGSLWYVYVIVALAMLVLILVAAVVFLMLRLRHDQQPLRPMPDLEAPSNARESNIYDVIRDSPRFTRRPYQPRETKRFIRISKLNMMKKEVNKRITKLFSKQTDSGLASGVYEVPDESQLGDAQFPEKAERLSGDSDSKENIQLQESAHEHREGVSQTQADITRTSENYNHEDNLTESIARIAESNNSTEGQETADVHAIPDDVSSQTLGLNVADSDLLAGVTSDLASDLNRTVEITAARSSNQSDSSIPESSTL